MEDTILGVTGLVPDFSSPHLAVYLLWPTPLDISLLTQSRQTINMGKKFSKEVSTPLRPSVSSRLELVSPDTVPPDAFEDVLQKECRRNRMKYLGVMRR